MPSGDDPPQPPDLQEWVARYGGYLNIDWAKWDEAVATYQRERREILRRESPASPPERRHEPSK
jgi:hypothetical protein